MKKEQFISRQEFELTVNRIPELEKYRSNLTTMSQLDKSNMSIAEIEKLYFENAVVFPGKSLVVPPGLLNNIKLYRVRTNIDLQNENINSIEAYSYPPIDYCRSNGRGNLKGAPVFYCGHTLFTALKEAKIKKGDIGYLSIWSINATRSCEYGIFLPDELPENNPWKAMGSLEQVKNFNAYHNLDKASQFEYLHTYIAHLFLTEQAPYPLTSWLANKMLYGYDFIDFIVYPSFELKSSKCNLAFHPAFVDKYVVFEKVYIFKAVDVTDGNVAMKTLFVGKKSDDKIDWANLTDEDVDFLERK